MLKMGHHTEPNRHNYHTKRIVRSRELKIDPR